MTPYETARLRLRELTHDDAAFILELLNDPAWLRYIGDRNVRTLEDARDYIDRVRTGGYERHGFGLWVVERKDDGERTGICGLVKRDTLEHVDVGFAFLERHRGRGYAREAVEATLSLARDRHGLARVVAITTLDNSASQRVLEGAGFRFEKRFRMDEAGEELSLYALDLA